MTLGYAPETPDCLAGFSRSLQEVQGGEKDPRHSVGFHWFQQGWMMTTPSPEQMTMYVCNPTLSFPSGAGALPCSILAMRPMLFPSNVVAGL
jgi:hypothetical protein